jgi:para-nitrobenzyl esterase
MELCTVETASGKVRGLVNSGIRQFKGVPYGASTEGPNRFQRPRPPVPWSGVRDCVGYGPVSPQAPYDVRDDYARLIQFDLNVAFGGIGEDCLHLNIWTPGTGRQDKRAVLVSIHGGGFAISSGNHPMYDGAELASFGDVVVVSVTHRLSSFGYLDLADLDPKGPWEDSGAAGILDLVAALEWVRDNIESFGGDPHRVMLFGQSGGGWKVSTLLGMPTARGLFHRAAIQSGSLTTHLPREVSARIAQSFIEQLGLTPATLDRIRTLPWAQLLAAQTAVGAPMFAPVPDDVHISTDPLSEAGLSGCDAVPVIVSTTLDDAGLFFNHFDLTVQQLSDLLSARYGSAGTTLQNLYREHFPAKSPYLLHAQMVTDAGFRSFAHTQAEAKAARKRGPVYTYLWEWGSPAYNGKFGAAHAMDVSASFHNVRDAILGSGSRDARRMCDALASTWIAFAKTGDPNNSQIPHWPRFEGTERTTMVFDRNTRVEHDPHRELREFWRGMPPAASVLG